MNDAVEKIKSGKILDGVEHHFRVDAGPGAGKTFWLVEHIKSVLHKSTRLTPASRIACISYTNVAVNEIRERLGPAADRVDASTIHSFLYRNVVKPYLHVVRDTSGEAVVKFADVDGHNEHRPSYPKVDQWIGQLGIAKLRKFFRANRSALFTELRNTAFQLNPEGGRWVIRDSRFPSLANLSSEQIELYKAAYWSDGVIDHEDVLYFGHRILEEQAPIRPFLSARFPYIFVDEFQDTNPVQTQVVKWLGEGGSVVGVIGDPEQSIYGFQGARRQDFVNFSLPGLRNYRIEDNRRSTSPIVSLLNDVRTDGLKQKPLRKIEGVLVSEVAGEPVRVIVGPTTKTVERARSCLPDGGKLYVLARKNDEVARLRTDTGTPSDDAWVRFERADYRRARFFEHLITAVEAARLGNWTLGLKELLRGMWKPEGMPREPLKSGNAIPELQRRAIAVSLVEKILTDYAYISAATLIDVYDLVKRTVESSLPGLSLPGVKKGGVKKGGVKKEGFREFAEGTSYNDLAVSIQLADETRTVRTMHKAKGAQFANVLVCLGEGKVRRLGHILDPRDCQEHRVIYVALSRARERLFMSVSELSKAEEDKLKKRGLEIHRI